MFSFQSQGNTSKVYHPCYPSDFTEVFKLEKVFDSPCTASKRPKPFNPHSWIRVQGTGDYQSCLGNTSNIFSFQFCPFSQCSFNGVFQPNISGDFMVRGQNNGQSGIYEFNRINSCVFVFLLGLLCLFLHSQLSPAKYRDKHQNLCPARGGYPSCVQYDHRRGIICECVFFLSKILMHVLAALE